MNHENRDPRPSSGRIQWLLNTEALLAELARIRELAPRIPSLGQSTTSSMASAISKQRLRCCLHLHCEAQGAFSPRRRKKVPKRPNPSYQRRTDARKIALSFRLGGHPQHHFIGRSLPAVLFVNRRGCAAASWSIAEAMPRWRISGLTNTAATHGEYCGRCTQSFWMTEQLPAGIPRTGATSVYGTLSFCV
jgi:hypothetical protein